MVHNKECTPNIGAIVGTQQITRDDVTQAISAVEGQIAMQHVHLSKGRDYAMKGATSVGFPSVINGQRGTFSTTQGNYYSALEQLQAHHKYLAELLSTL